jgi:hypothetical protein
VLVAASAERVVKFVKVLVAEQAADENENQIP